MTRFWEWRNPNCCLDVCSPLRAYTH